MKINKVSFAMSNAINKTTSCSNFENIIIFGKTIKSCNAKNVDNISLAILREKS